jgi:pSer/pThr/pTyr-binding forkhead associated (FHA) protein
MSELTLLILRIGFLIVLWLFVFAVVYALRSDLFGQRVRRLPANMAPATPFATVVATPAATSPTRSGPPTAPTVLTSMPPAPPTPNPMAATSATASRLVIISGAKEGLELPLSAEQLTIGRSSDSGLVIRDDYTSTHHARLMLWDDVWMIQDLDSTNGTFLDGNRVSIPTPVPLNTPVRIGATSFELRR